MDYYKICESFRRVCNKYKETSTFFDRLINENNPFQFIE